MLIALTRPVSASLARCELTHVARQPVDVDRAAAQHARYEAALRAAGASVRALPAAHDLPDAVFVEDTAVVLDELAVITRPGAASRRPETDAVAEALGEFRPLARLSVPATLDGGDVLQSGRTLYVGRSSRTNGAGIDQLGKAVHEFGYRVVPVELRGCLHLKSAVTRVADGLLLHNPDWVDAAAFVGHDFVSVDEGEPHAGNALAIGGAVIVAAHHPRTLERLAARGLRVVAVDCDELAKAEGGVTCCSLVLAGEARAR